MIPVFTDLTFVLFCNTPIAVQQASRRTPADERRTGPFGIYLPDGGKLCPGFRAGT
jgi:hypothetical protein